MTHKHKLDSISDDELLRRLSELLQQSRRVESELIAHIGEVDERRLYRREASASMFAYCTEVLHLSEAEAYLRIAVARASRQHPMLLEMLGDGRLHLSGIAKLAPHLTKTNRQTLLARAAHRSKREIEELIAELTPRPDVPTMVRKLPERRTSTPPKPHVPPTPAEQLRPAGVVSRSTPVPVRQPAKVVEPLAPSRYKIQFTASAELHQKLQRLSALTGSADLAEVIEQAVTEKLERLESRRFGKTKAARKSLEQTDTSPSSRYIPAAVKRAVWERDGNQCTFVDAHGRRCTKRDGLEFHHDQPFGRGGDHSPENVHMMCAAHNRYLAERDFGKEMMEQYRRSGSCAREPEPVYSIGNRVAPVRAVEPVAAIMERNVLLDQPSP
jgi:hypothetical protein